MADMMMMSERPLAVASMPGPALVAAVEVASGVSIGNYKGVMLNRPFAGVVQQHMQREV